jgi:ADP-ribosyl-[dinitrogen reductase] hydrolase
LPGKLLAGEYPGGTTSAATRQRLRRLTEAGVGAFIDLTQPGELLSYANFRDAVLAAANLGDNSDVTASVTGALAGAHYTAGAIPALWRNSLMKQGLIESFADRLLTHALVELGS